jgi:hypothetical protein
MEIPVTAAIQSPQPYLMAGILAFCRKHGCPSLQEWPESILVEYLLFHFRNGNGVFVADGEVSGLAVGWQCSETNLEKHWQASDPSGTCFYFAQLAVTNREALKRIMYEFTIRVPHWSRLRLFARRHGKMTELPQRVLRLLWKRTL